MREQTNKSLKLPWSTNFHFRLASIANPNITSWVPTVLHYSPLARFFTFSHSAIEYSSHVTTFLGFLDCLSARCATEVELSISRMRISHGRGQSKRTTVRFRHGRLRGRRRIGNRSRQSWLIIHTSRMNLHRCSIAEWLGGLRTAAAYRKQRRVYQR